MLNIVLRAACNQRDSSKKFAPSAVIIFMLKRRALALKLFFFCGYNLLCFVLLLAKKHGSEMQCTSVTYLLPGQGNGFIMCSQSFENIDAIENRGSTKCYNFNVLENWQREGDTKDDRLTACENFYFIYGKDYYK